MATTKKVASTRSLTKKTALKKSAVSSRAKTPVKKKITSKSNKKGASKSKTTVKSQVKVPIKKVFKTGVKRTKAVKINDKTKTQKSFQQKIVSKNVRAAKKKSSPPEKRISKRRSLFPSLAKIPMNIALLSATRLPMSIDAFAIQTARIGGLAIIALGAFFTLLYSQYIWNAPIVASNTNGVHMLGTVTSCDPLVMTTTQYSMCLSLYEGESGSGSTSSVRVGSLTMSTTDETATTVSEPPATFNIPSSEPLSGIVSIQIAVDNAEKVRVLVFEESYNTPVVLGLADEIEPGIWEYYWDTTGYKDVRYKVVADIWNVYTFNEPYRDSDDSGYLQVSNEVVVNDSVEVDDSEALDEEPNVQLELISDDPVVGNAKFEIHVADAERVELYAYHKDSGSSNRLGEARLGADGIWIFIWDTVQFSEGDYVITARVTNKYGSYRAGTESLTVKNIPENKISTIETESTETIPNDESLEDSTNEVEFLTKPPEAVLKVLHTGVLSDVVDLRVDITVADFVELWVIPEGSKTEKIIALAKKSDPNSEQWVHQWNTSKVPNGEYMLFARVKNDFGIYKSSSQKIKIFNEPYRPTLTEDQEKTLKTIAEAQAVEESIKTESTDSKSVVVDSTNQSEDEPTVTTKTDSAEDILASLQEQIDTELQRLITAYRTKDQEIILRAEERIERLKKTIVDSVPSTEMNDELLQEINKRIDSVVADHKRLAVKAEALITQRVGESVFNDSDSDGISDYDEKTLYNTDPYSADTDGDGFNDGAEVFEGYDPLDVKREVAVTYESPKEKGIVREDILVVESVIAVVPEDPAYDTDGVEAQAVISGKALPNSFVTLYIFSTPVVITVKTEADGSWKYRFDKELEDGEHNIYVGVTDNAGRIVAKSAAFTFVKEAQAFSPVENTVDGPLTNNNQSDSLMSTYMIYLILSISVVSIGLVLILLGLHLDTRQRRFKEVINTEDES